MPKHKYPGGPLENEYEGGPIGLVKFVAKGIWNTATGPHMTNPVWDPERGCYVDQVTFTQELALPDEDTEGQDNNPRRRR